MTSELMMVRTTINPETAAAMLTRVDIQRKIKPTVVAAYTADMRAGRWTDDITPIAFDAHGHLVNGQHRLRAIVESGITLQFWVLKNVNLDSILRMDQGTNRTAADQIRFMGAANAEQMTAAARMFLFYRTQPNVVWRSMGGPTRAHIVDETLTNFEQWERALHSVSGIRRAGVNVTVAVTLARLVDEDSVFPEMLPDFVRGIVTGADLKDGDPRLAVRNFWARIDRPRPWGWQQSNILAMILAWNRYAKDENLRLLKHPRREQLPMPRVA